MNFRIGRILLAAFGAEVMAILALVLIVFLFGPSDPDGAQDYAMRMGYWTGPIAGFLFTLLAAWWVARSLADGQLMHGIATGVAVAVIDIAILVASGTEFAPIFVISNTGRVIAGGIGGWLSSRAARSPTDP